MFFQLIVEILIVSGCIYLVYRILFKEKRAKKIETKKLLKEEKLRQLKEKENELKEEVVITEDLIDTKRTVSKLDKEVRKLDSKISEV